MSAQFAFAKRDKIVMLIFGAACLFGHPTLKRLAFGLPILLLGIGLRFYCVSYLGEIVYGGRTNKLVSHGPYSVVRNPIYLANTLGAFGSAFCLGAWWTAATVVVLLAALHSILVRFEEERLQKIFGDEYKFYRTRVPSYIPNLSLISIGGQRLAFLDVLRVELRLLCKIVLAVSVIFALFFLKA